MKQKLRIAIVILMALSLISATFSYFFDFYREKRIYYTPRFYSDEVYNYYKDGKRLPYYEAEKELRKIANEGEKYDYGLMDDVDLYSNKGRIDKETVKELGGEKRSVLRLKASKFRNQALLLYLVILLIGVGLLLYLLREGLMAKIKQEKARMTVILMALSIAFIAFFSLFELGAERTALKDQRTYLQKELSKGKIEGGAFATDYSSLAEIRKYLTKNKQELKKASPYAITRRKATDFGLALIGGAATLIIGGLFLYLLKESEKKG